MNVCQCMSCTRKELSIRMHTYAYMYDMHTYKLINMHKKILCHIHVMYTYVYRYCRSYVVPCACTQTEKVKSKIFFN